MATLARVHADLSVAVHADLSISIHADLSESIISRGMCLLLVPNVPAAKPWSTLRIYNVHFIFASLALESMLKRRISSIFSKAQQQAPPAHCFASIMERMFSSCTRYRDMYESRAYFDAFRDQLSVIIANMSFSEGRSFLILKRIGSGYAFVSSRRHARLCFVPSC